MSTFIFLSSLGGGGGTEITVVDNYTALLALPPTADTFYWCQNSQGTAWLPGSVGGTYYPKGIYYCFTTSPLVIEYIETPYQATQAEVDAGTNDNKFVTSKTFNDSAQLISKANLSGATFTGNISATNLSGTNTGDETQSSILSKLGWFTYNRVAESTAVTGTTAETIIENITISANTFASGGIIRSYNNKFRKVGNNGTLAVRLYIGPTANNLTGATPIGSFTGIIASQNFAEMLRTFTATTSGILGFSATQSAAVDTGNSSAGRLSASIDWSVNQYFMITVQLGSGSDSVSLIGASLKNF